MPLCNVDMIPDNVDNSEIMINNVIISFPYIFKNSLKKLNIIHKLENKNKKPIMLNLKFKSNNITSKVAFTVTNSVFKY